MDFCLWVLENLDDFDKGNGMRLGDVSNDGIGDKDLGMSGTNLKK